VFRSLIYRTGAHGGDVSFNVTPLIDCTFLLIIFFILASQMASDSLAALELPRPHASLAAMSDRREVRRLIVNVLSAQDEEGRIGADRAGQAAAYKIEGRRVEVGDFEALTELLRSRRQAPGGQELVLEIRADRRVQFGHIQPVMDAAAAAGIAQVNLTALLEGGREL
jgi:biopolymer transport protein ExbD